MTEGKGYSDLGDVMDAIARRHNVRGPYNVGNYVLAKTGKGPKRGSAWSQIFYGQSHPTQKTMDAFLDAFPMTEEEVSALARAYLFRRATTLAGQAA
jgi:hypothetical protein